MGICRSQDNMWFVYLISLAFFAKFAGTVDYTTSSPASYTEETVNTTDNYPSTSELLHQNVTNAVETVTDIPLNNLSTTPENRNNQTTSSVESEVGNVRNVTRPILSVKKLQESNVSLSYDVKTRSKFEKKKRMEQHRLDKLARERERAEARAKLARERAIERQKKYRIKEKSVGGVKISYYKKKPSRSKKKMLDSNRPVKKICVECEKRLLTEQKEINRKASLKFQILEKLQIDLSLNIPRPVVPPEVLIRSMMGDESNDEDDGYAKTTDIMIFGHDITRKCRNRKSTGCFKFNLRNKIAGQVTSAELLVYKLHDPNDGQQSIILSELERPKFRKLMPKNIVNRMDTDITEGWLKFRLDKAVQRWVNKPYTNDGIALKCKTCARKSHKQLYSAKEGYKPVLIIHIQPPSKRRQKRSLDCGAQVNSCCKHNFWVDFGEINLFRVLQPLGIWANYCTGSCSGRNGGHYNHTILLGDIRFRSETANGTIRNAIVPCCGAVRLKTMSLLYVDDSGDIRHGHVPNLAVEECGCL